MSLTGVNENFSIEHLFRYTVDLVYSQRIPEPEFAEFVNVTKYNVFKKIPLSVNYGI
jgi:hypothetical protein